MHASSLPFVLAGLVMAALHSASASNFPGFSEPVEFERARKHARSHGTRVFVAINSDCETARALGPAIAKTWYRAGPARTYVTARLVIGNSAKGRNDACTGDRDVERDLVTYLPWCPDTYPPVTKVLCMWQYMKNTWLSSYTHFLKVDADALLNLDNLLRLAADMPATEPLFAGARGFGRGSDRGQVPPFCLGPAYVVTAALLGRLPDDVGRTPPESLPPNSDRSFSLIVQRATNLTCMENVPQKYQWAFMNRYWDVADNGTFIYPTLSGEGQMQLGMRHGLISSHISAVSVHPLKTADDLVAMDQAMRSMRLPLFKLPAPVDEAAHNRLKPLCVYNPTRQYEVSGITLRECPARSPAETPPAPSAISAHILHLTERPSSVMRAANLTDWLRGRGVPARAFAGVNGPAVVGDAADTYGKGAPLRSAERGLRATFARLLVDILGSPLERESSRLHMVLEDDALLAPEFDKKLAKLLANNARCGRFLSVAPGGVLLLGATVWREGTYPRLSPWTSGWRQYDAEVAAHKGLDRACYNVGNATYGTFGFVADTQTLRLMYYWLSDPRFADRPVDHVWPWLGDIGAPVRALSPPLVVPLVTDSIIHTEDTHTNATYRNKIHRWTFA